MNIIVLYGTETGNTEMLALDLKSHLQTTHKTEAKNFEIASISDLSEPDFVVVMSSSYGEGELPISARPFFERLNAHTSELNVAPYAVFATADSQYPETFGGAAKTIDRTLSSLGGQRIGEIGFYDSSGTEAAESLLFAWIQPILDGLDAQMNNPPVLEHPTATART